MFTDIIKVVEEVKLFNIKIYNTRTVAWCYCNKQPGGVIVPSELVKTTNAIHRLQILNPNSQTVPEGSVYWRCLFPGL